MLRDVPLNELPDHQEFYCKGMSDDHPKGRISCYLTVWCGLCPGWLYVEAKTKAKAAVEARGKGWVNTRARGWLCPECAKGAADA